MARTLELKFMSWTIRASKKSQELTQPLKTNSGTKSSSWDAKLRTNAAGSKSKKTKLLIKNRAGATSLDESWDSFLKPNSRSTLNSNSWLLLLKTFRQKKISITTNASSGTASAFAWTIALQSLLLFLRGDEMMPGWPLKSPLEISFNQASLKAAFLSKCDGSFLATSWKHLCLLGLFLITSYVA